MMTMGRAVSRIRYSLTLYPVTVLYVAGATIAWLIAAKILTLAIGLMLLTVVASLMAVVGMWREVHIDLAQHHTELIRQVNLINKKLDAVTAPTVSDSEDTRS